MGQDKKALVKQKKKRGKISRGRKDNRKGKWFDWVVK